MTAIIDDGFTFRFDYPSIYEVTVFASDTYGIVGETTKVVDARDIIKFNQTLLFKYSPWQGFNITDAEKVPNSKYKIESRDIDKRPSLGLWYFDDLILVLDFLVVSVYQFLIHPLSTRVGQNRLQNQTIHVFLIL